MAGRWSRNSKGTNSMVRTSKKAAKASGDLLNITEAEVGAMTPAQLVTLIRGLAGSALANRKADPVEAGWTAWAPSLEAPEPSIAPGTMIRVRLRRGHVLGPRAADSFNWAHGGKEDIIGWQVVDEAPAGA